MEDERSNSREASPSAATPDFSTNQSFPTVDANRLLEAYHHPMEAQPSHIECPDRFRSRDRQAQTHYSSTQHQNSHSNWSLQNFDGNLPHTTYGNWPAQNVSNNFPDMTSHRYWPVQTVGANLSYTTSHDYLPTQNAGAHFSDMASHQNWPVQAVGANWSHHTLHNNWPSQTIQSSWPVPINQTVQAPQSNWPIQVPHSTWSVQTDHTVVGATLPGKDSYGTRPAQLPNSNCPEQACDLNWPLQHVDTILPIHLRGINKPDQTVYSNSPKQTATAQLIQTADANAAVQTVGAYEGGHFTAQNVKITANARSSLASQTSRKSTFRLPTSSTTVGFYAEGNVEANNITNHINNINVHPSSQKRSRIHRKTPFRCNVPTPTEHFKGRQDTLGELQEFYTKLPVKSSNCWERIVAIVGLGGMGKTETASKYAAQHRDTFPNAAWVNAETEQGMLNSFLDLAKKLGVAEEDQNSADLSLVKKVYDYIDQEYDSNSLFIFDNAIQLNSDGADVGILDFLPTDDLPNQRFPNILITTQTPDWGKRIRTLQVEELNEEKALEFYASCFKVKSSECTEEFKMLNDLLKGYPLCMNLAVSSIDFDSNKDSVNHLKQQIQLYIAKVKKEQERLTTEKIKPAWGHKYHKTLSTVWQLTQERIQKQENGPEALEILQIMSFLRLPVHSNNLANILDHNTDCTHPEFKDIQFRLKKLFRVLEKVYAVRILEVYGDNEYDFLCDLGVHRLVQLVVRQQTNCNQALETVLRGVGIVRFLDSCVDFTAIEEALENPRKQLTSRSLPYVAALALNGSRTARKFFETRTPETEADEIFWRLCSLMANTTTSGVISHQVIRELIGLTKSSERLVDRQFFAKITLALAYPDSEKKPWKNFVDPWKNLRSLNLNLDSFDGIEDVTVEFVLNICSFQDSGCKLNDCRGFDTPVVELIKKLVTGFLQVDAHRTESVVVKRLADTWLAFLAKHRNYESLGHSLWAEFWKTIYETFNSPDASPLRIGELRTCLWDRGLVAKLIQVFKSFKLCDWSNIPYQAFPDCIDVCLEGRNLLDMRVQQVISAFTETTTNCYLENPNSSGSPSWIKEARLGITCEVCLVWIKLLLMDGDRTSESILECLSRCEALNWFEGTSREDIIRDIEGHMKTRSMRNNRLYRTYHSEYLREFILRYSSSQVGQIKAIRAFCEIALALPLLPMEFDSELIELGRLDYELLNMGIFPRYPPLGSINQQSTDTSVNTT